MQAPSAVIGPKPMTVIHSGNVRFAGRISAETHPAMIDRGGPGRKVGAQLLEHADVLFAWRRWLRDGRWSRRTWQEQKGGSALVSPRVTMGHAGTV